MASKVITEGEILEKVVSPKMADLTPSVARSLLSFKFDKQTTACIRQLLRKNNRGAISAEERLALERYLRVGQLLDLLHAKVRCSLQAAGNSH